MDLKVESMDSKEPKVLVADANSFGALPVLRSLEKRGIKTTLLTDKMVDSPAFSRYTSQRILVSLAKNNPQFPLNLLNIVKSGMYSTIFPLSDGSTLRISENRGLLEKYVKLALPDHSAIIATLDKSKTKEVAKKVGVPVPATFYAKNDEDLKDIASTINYPAVIKPRTTIASITKPKISSYNDRPIYVRSPFELESAYKKVDENFPSPMIEEYVSGYNVSVPMMYQNGIPKAACCIKVYRANPFMGGNSVLRESITMDPLLLRYSEDLLGELNWNGVAEVEFRVDSEGKAPKLLEINPRFWGSMTVAIASGIDFPYLLYQIAEGKTISSLFNYRVGVKFHWLNGDLSNLLLLLKGRTDVNKNNYTSKRKAIFDVLKTFEAGIHYDGFTLSDPLPFFAEEGLFAFNLIKENIKRKQVPNQFPELAT